MCLKNNFQNTSQLLLCINEKLSGNNLSPVDQLRQQSIKIQHQH